MMAFYVYIRRLMRFRIHSFNTILHIFKWEVWKIRNIIKYENIRYTSGSITKTVLHKIKSCCKFWAQTNVKKKQNAVLNLLQKFNPN